MKPQDANDKVPLASQPTGKVVRVFLCHNSKDKGSVRHIADSLELDFGTPHFLDAYAIPAGDAFLPWIEKAQGERRPLWPQLLAAMTVDPCPCA